jgi:hypothetical protein
MIFRPAPYYYSRRGSSRINTSSLSRLPVIAVLLAAFCWSSSRRLTAAFSRVHPSSSTASIYAITRRHSSSASATPSRLSLISVQAVGSSNTDDTNTTTMTSPPPLSSSAITVPGLASQTLSNLVEYATSFSAAHGLQVELRDSSSSSANNNIGNNNHHRGYITAPISLLPQSYPSHQFRMATLLAAPFNILVDKISNDATFLQETLSDVRNVDEYTGKLLDLYEEIYLGKSRTKYLWFGNYF